MCLVVCLYCSQKAKDYLQKLQNVCVRVECWSNALFCWCFCFYKCQVVILKGCMDSDLWQGILLRGMPKPKHISVSCGPAKNVTLSRTYFLVLHSIQILNSILYYFITKLSMFNFLNHTEKLMCIGEKI